MDEKDRAERARDDAILAAAVAIVRARQQARGEAATKDELELMARMGLPSDPTGRIVSSMNVDDTGQSEAVKRAIARGRRNHPAQVILYEAGVTITDVAAELKETRQRVSAWMSDDPKAVRAIPRRVAEHLKRKYKIPLSAWSRIAD